MRLDFVFTNNLTM